MPQESVGVMNSTLPELSAADFTYAAEEAGFQSVSLRISKDMDVPATQAALKDTGLHVVDVEFATFTAKTRREHWAWMLPTATALGANFINVGCKHPDFGLFTRQLTEFAHAAADTDIRLLLEPIKFYSPANYPQMAELAQQLPATGILLDALQLYRFAVKNPTDTLEVVTERALATADDVAALTGVFQLCDIATLHPTPSPTTGSDPAEFYEHEARFHRPLPGTGVVDLDGLLQRLPNVPVSVESPNRELVERYGVVGYLRMLRESVPAWPVAKIPAQPADHPDHKTNP